MMYKNIGIQDLIFYDYPPSHEQILRSYTSGHQCRLGTGRLPFWLARLAFIEHTASLVSYTIGKSHRKSVYF